MGADPAFVRQADVLERRTRTRDRPGGPAIVLVEPQLGENIGAAARAMLNCGLTDLRIVRPRDGWPNEKAKSAATGAASVVKEARLFSTSGEAIADVEHVYATTARRREMRKSAVTAAEAALEIQASLVRGERSAILFGPERTGLDNDDVALAEKILHIPLNPAFSSLNLAQAVLLVAYEWFRRAAGGTEAQRSGRSRSRAATSGQLQNFFEHLEQELDASGFLRVREKRAVMVRNLRNLFQRAELDEHEVRTLHGILAALTGRRKDGAPARQPRSGRGE